MLAGRPPRSGASRSRFGAVPVGGGSAMAGADGGASRGACGGRPRRGRHRRDRRCSPECRSFFAAVWNVVTPPLPRLCSPACPTRALYTLFLPFPSPRCAVSRPLSLTPCLLLAKPVFFFVPPPPLPSRHSCPPTPRTGCEARTSGSPALPSARDAPADPTSCWATCLTRTSTRPTSPPSRRLSSAARPPPSAATGCRRRGGRG